MERDKERKREIEPIFGVNVPFKCGNIRRLILPVIIKLEVSIYLTFEIVLKHLHNNLFS